MLPKNRTTLPSLGLVAALCASCATTAGRASVSDPATPGFASDGTPTLSEVDPATVLQDEPTPWHVGLSGSSYSEADLDGDDLEITRFGVDGSYTMPTEGGQKWVFHAGHEISEYEVDGDDTFDDATVTTFGAVYVHPGQDWSWFGVLNVNSGVDDDADFSDGIYFEGGGGFLYTVNEDLKIGLGLFGRDQIEEDPDFFPFPLVEWTINEHSRVGIVRSSDPSLGYTYTMNEAWDFYAGIQAAQRQYAIDDDIVDDAAFVDEEQAIKFGVLYNNNDGFNGEAFVGSAQRTFEVDVDGDEVADEDVDPEAFFGFAIGFSF